MSLGDVDYLSPAIFSKRLYDITGSTTNVNSTIYRERVVVGLMFYSKTETFKEVYK